MRNKVLLWIGLEFTINSSNLVRILLSVLFSLSFQFNLASSITIGVNHPVKKLKTAFIFAKENDTVFIDGGTYKEGNITLSKSLNIIGLNNPVIDGEGQMKSLPYRLITSKLKELLLKIQDTPL